MRHQWRTPWSVVAAMALHAPCVAILALFSFAAELTGVAFLLYASLWIIQRAWRES
jgi:hypothetical protein